MKVQYKKKTMKKRKSSGKKHMRKNTKRRTIKKNKGRKMSRKSSCHLKRTVFEALMLSLQGKAKKDSY